MLPLSDSVSTKPLAPRQASQVTLPIASLVPADEIIRIGLVLVSEKKVAFVKSVRQGSAVDE